MRHLAVIGTLCFLAASLPAAAQIEVAAQTERTNFLLYERVDLLVTVTNNGDSEVSLSNNEDHPWLSFLVSRHSQHNYVPVHAERASSFGPLSLKSGESKTLRVNITPLFTFRQEGQYRTAAVIDLPGAGQIVSENVPFNVINGRQVWTQTRPVDGSQRTYSLIRFSPDANTTNLYLRIEDPAENIVYANLGLGEVVAFIDPEVFFDPQGNIHVLHPIASGTYLYTRADQNGKIEHQAIFKTLRDIPPRLRKVGDGNVTVVGGFEENPNAPREKLSDGQKTQKAEAPEQKTDAPNTPAPDARPQ